MHNECVGFVMPVTLTIKQVPETVADGLRRRAAANHRSMQRELLLIAERAAIGDDLAGRIAEPTPQYASNTGATKGVKPSRPSRAGKLSLEQMWQRARKLGAPMPAESAAIVRRDRDARQRR